MHVLLNHFCFCIHIICIYFSYISDYNIFIITNSTLNYSTLACVKYSTPNKIAHINCVKTGDMEIAHHYVLKMAHHFSLC